MRKFIFLGLWLLCFSAWASTLKVATYNTGLAESFVNYAAEREDHVVHSLMGSDADVLCLQEVWDEKVRENFREKLSLVFSHEMSTEVKQTRADEAPTCRIRDLFGEGKFVSCMQENCSGKEGDAFTNCLLDSCGGVFHRLKERNRQCATALMAQVGKSTLGGLWAVMNPFVPAGLYTYEGSDGLMLFSRYPLKEREVLDMSDISTLSRRRVLMATVKKEKKEYRVACTHMTANLHDSVPYSGTSKDWEKENALQVDRLLKNVRGKERPLVLLGDFNSGPTIPSAGIYGEFEENYEKFLNDNFVDPVTERGDPECTFCAKNPLVHEGNDPKDLNDLIIDHVFVKHAVPLKTEVKMTEDLPLIIDRDIISSKFSDHYLVEVIIE